MGIPKLDYFIDLAEEIVDQDAERDEYIDAFEDIIALDWDLPDELEALPWMRKFISSTPVDDLDAAVRTLSTVMPTVRVTPHNTSAAERERVEAIEDALLWHFVLANQRGIERPLEQIVASVLKYGIVAVQVDYIPHRTQGLSGPRVRAMRRAGDFSYTVHHPKNVHARWSNTLLEGVLLKQEMSVADLRRIYPDEPKVKEVVKWATQDEKDMATLERTGITLYDYMDWEYRVIWVGLGQGTGSGADTIELRREAHGLPFLPWTYRKVSKPFLKTVVDSKSWENQNVMLSLQYAIVASLVAGPKYWTETHDGEGVELDFTDPSSTANLMHGERIGVLPPPQIDPNLERITQSGEGRIGAQTSARALTAAANIAASAPFATFNAIMQVTAASLGVHRQCMESALEDIFTIQLEWLKHSKIPLAAYRPKSRRNAVLDARFRRGAPVVIGMEGAYDYSLEDLCITVKLRPDTPTDRQSRINEAVQLMTQLGMSREDALENAGLDDMEVDESKYIDEQILRARLQKEVQKIISEASLEVQARAEQMRAQMMAEMQQQQAVASPSPFDQTQGQGYAPGMGGQSPYMAAPAETREMITGQTITGEEAMRQ